MAGRGPVPKTGRQNKYDVRLRGDPHAVDGVGWQHGDQPPPPPKLLKVSQETWGIWLSSWFAAHWTPADVPGLRQVIRLWDQVERGEFTRASELRLAMDTYGITPKGQQDRRWLPPKDDAVPAQKPQSSYRNLRVVGE
jgi:hypothetical protein